MARSGSRCRAWLAIVAVALLWAPLAPAAGAAPDPGDDEEADARREAIAEARDALRAAGVRLTAARGETASARASGRSADAGVRSTEERLAPALLARREVEEQLVVAEAQVRALRRELRATALELDEARERLADRVVHAYKQGSIGADPTLPLLAAREAGSPGEFAHALKDLEVLALAGATRVDDLLARRVRLEAELVTAHDAVTAAEEALGAAAADLDDQERSAARRRLAAQDAEARLLTAVERELAAQRERDAARAALAAIREDDEPAGPTADDDEGPAERAEALTGRQRALARQRSLPAERRRTADDWACPVEDGRYVNDWAFPRSHERRHEGTDVFAPTGTEVVAVTDGTVTSVGAVDRFDGGRRGLGGITVSYERDGHRLYNAHLQAVHPDVEVGEELAAGDVLGWVGRTGNARSTPPHLHLGWYVDDVAVNPYASLRVACDTDASTSGD